MMIAVRVICLCNRLLFLKVILFQYCLTIIGLLVHRFGRSLKLYWCKPTVLFTAVDVVMKEYIFRGCILKARLMSH